jgi:hypothetical protein
MKAVSGFFAILFAVAAPLWGTTIVKMDLAQCSFEYLKTYTVSQSGGPSGLAYVEKNGKTGYLYAYDGNLILLYEDGGEESYAVQKSPVQQSPIVSQWGIATIHQDRSVSLVSKDIIGDVKLVPGTWNQYRGPNHNGTAPAE